MTLIEKIRKNIQEHKMPPIFNHSDLKKIGIEDKNYNLSNYDKKNKGKQNSHKQFLVSTEIENIIYYTFDEKLFN